MREPEGEEAEGAGEQAAVAYVAPAQGHDALVRAANDLLLASENFCEMENGVVVLGEMATLIGGLHQTVYALSDLLTKPRPAARAISDASENSRNGDLTDAQGFSIGGAGDA